MFITKRAYQLWIAGAVSLCCLASTSLSQAQVTSDGTVSTKVTTSPNQGSACSNNAFVGNITNGSANLFLNQEQVPAKAELVQIATLAAKEGEVDPLSQRRPCGECRISGGNGRYVWQPPRWYCIGC